VARDARVRNGQEMRITSTDSKAWVEITRGNSKFSFSIECMADRGQSLFHGKNSDFHFLNIDEFIIDLNKFILDRNISPKLNGIYGPCLEFSRSKKQTTTVVVYFSVSDDSSAYSENVEFKTMGTFEINSEFLNDYLRGFKELIET
jgi:hypothetical protein